MYVYTCAHFITNCDMFTENLAADELAGHGLAVDELAVDKLLVSYISTYADALLSHARVHLLTYMCIDVMHKLAVDEFAVDEIALNVLVVDQLLGSYMR